MQSPVQTKVMDFPEAVRVVTEGAKVTRREWNNPESYVVLRDGFLCLKNEGGFHRLLVSEGDLLGKDWVVVYDQFYHQFRD